MRAPAENIGLVKLGAIGDVVNSLPLVNRMRDGYPGARITWVIGPLAHALVAGHPAVDEFLVFHADRPGTWPGFVRALRARRFDLVLDLQRLFKSGLIARLSGAPLRVGFDRARCKEHSHLFTNRHLAPNAAPGVTVSQYLEFADLLELPAREPRFDLPIAPVDPARPGELRIVLNVGASKPANRWPIDRWAAVCQSLVSEFQATIHLTGGQQDKLDIGLVRAATGLSPEQLVDRAGTLSLAESAGLIRSAALFIGGDTGPLHIAVAVGTPVVALFGAADPRRTGPFLHPESVVQNPVPCSPCRRRECNVAGHPCMSGLEVAVVLDRVRHELARRPSR